MADSAYTYYTTSSKHGGYQFTGLTELVDIMMLREESNYSSYAKNKNRDLFILYAKQGIKELTADMANDVLALELEIGDDLQFVFPQDYVNWVRLSVVGKDGRLYELDRNTRANRAITYLQDHNYDILFDHDGDELEADGNNVFNKQTPLKRRIYSSATPQFQLDTTKLSKHGEFVVDKRRGVFAFDSSLAGKNIVLEYISDGLQWNDIHEGDITVHKYFEEPLQEFVYFRLIERDRDVPDREKYRAQRKFWGARQKAFARFANINLTEVSRAFRARTKWLKT